MSQKVYDDILDKQNNGNMRWHFIFVECEDKLHCCSPNQTAVRNATNENGSTANPSSLYRISCDPDFGSVPENQTVDSAISSPEKSKLEKTVLTHGTSR